MIEANGHPVKSTAASGTVLVVDNPTTGVGIHLPTVPQEGPHAAAGALLLDNANKTPQVPTTKRFHMADGFRPSFHSLSFPSGNQSPRDNWVTGRVCLNNSSPNEFVNGALGGIPLDASNTSSPPYMEGHIKSPCPSDKERLARACQTSLYNIAVLLWRPTMGVLMGYKPSQRDSFITMAMRHSQILLPPKTSLFATMKSNIIRRCYNYGKTHDPMPRVHPLNGFSKRAFRYSQSFARWRPTMPLSSTISSKNSLPFIYS